MHPSGRTKLAACHGEDAVGIVKLHWYSVYYGLIGVFECIHLISTYVFMNDQPHNRKGELNISNTIIVVHRVHLNSAS